MTYNEQLSNDSIKLLNLKPKLDGYVDYLEVSIDIDRHAVRVVGTDIEGLRLTRDYFNECGDTDCSVTNIDELPTSPIVDGMLTELNDLSKRHYEEQVQTGNSELIDKMMDRLKTEFDTGQHPDNYIGEIYTLINPETNKVYQYPKIVIITKVLDYTYPYKFEGITLDFENIWVQVELTLLELDAYLGNDGGLLSDINGGW